jgi:hypothetical protein
MGFASEAAFWLALAWMAIIVMAIISTIWRPHHTHPAPAQCQCADCIVRRAGGTR